MENSQVQGYLSEKLIMAAMAYTVPIYFGTEDVFTYLNPKRIIHCSLSQNSINQIRKRIKVRYPEIPYVSPKEINMEWLTDEYTEDNYSFHTNLRFGVNSLRWVIKNFRHELQPCIDKFIYVNENDKIYLEMLKQPIYYDNNRDDTIFDGTTSARAMVHVLELLQSPILDIIDSYTTHNENELFEKQAFRVHRPDYLHTKARLSIKNNN